MESAYGSFVALSEITYGREYFIEPGNGLAARADAGLRKPVMTLFLFSIGVSEIFYFSSHNILKFMVDGPVVEEILKRESHGDIFTSTIINTLPTSTILTLPHNGSLQLAAR